MITVEGRRCPAASSRTSRMIAHGRPGWASRSLAMLVALVSVLGAACTAGGAGTTGSHATAWRTASLHDVLAGSDFSLADLRGRLVAVETMAIWCINCRLQQQQAQAAIAAVDSPDLVYISLDVDPNEREADLVAYARKAGFDWRFAVASPDVARSLAATFGDEILSPPSTPLLIIGPDGALVSKHLGIQGADALASLLRANLP
ncbi:MAG: hypothetical protein DLM71_00945 [Chloroflexi bacterium]|nr:MAG: hypothetical protein DLM71_00945 [Chloroflexota bacterium]